MLEPDLRAPRLRILECGACGEPVWAEPTGATLRLHCGYCGHDDVRELAPPPSVEATDDAYRGTVTRRRSRPVQVDLSTPPPGVPRRANVKLMRAALAAARTELAALDADAETRADVELRVLFSSAVLATEYIRKHDLLRARAVLESALETHRTPAYRALVLARLARVATLSDAPELAERWLDAIPQDLRIAEVGCDVRLARAMLARARGDAKQMLEELGSEASFVAASRPLAMALRVDAHERLGELREARAVYRRGARGSALVFGAAINAFALAPKTRRRTIWVGGFAIGLIIFACGALGLGLRGQLLEAIAVMLLALVAAIALKRF